MRPLRDRIGEAMRRARIGLARPLWADLPDYAQEDYRKAADFLLGHLATELRYEIREAGDVT